MAKAAESPLKPLRIIIKEKHLNDIGVLKILHNYTCKSPTLKSIDLRQIYSVTKLIYYKNDAAQSQTLTLDKEEGSRACHSQLGTSSADTWLQYMGQGSTGLLI
jgi:hypothetical protein